MPRVKRAFEGAGAPELNEVCGTVLQEVVSELTRQGIPLPLGTLSALKTAVEKKISAWPAAGAGPVAGGNGTSSIFNSQEAQP